MSNAVVEYCSPHSTLPETEQPIQWRQLTQPGGCKMCACQSLSALKKTSRDVQYAKKGLNAPASRESSHKEHFSPEQELLTKCVGALFLDMYDQGADSRAFDGAVREKVTGMLARYGEVADKKKKYHAAQFTASANDLQAKLTGIGQRVGHGMLGQFQELLARNGRLGGEVSFLQEELSRWEEDVVVIEQGWAQKEAGLEAEGRRAEAQLREARDESGLLQVKAVV